MATMRLRSDLAKWVTMPPILLACLFQTVHRDNEHGDKEDDVAVDEACKSSLDVQHAGDDQTDTDDHGRYAEGDLLKHEHDDREEKKE